MAGMGQVTAASDGSVESTLVMGSLGYESAPLWPDVPGVFFPEPYAVDHPWSEGLPSSPENLDPTKTSPEIPTAISGEWTTDLSTDELAALETEPTYIDLGEDDVFDVEDAEEQRASLKLIERDSDLDELDEADIEEIEFDEPGTARSATVPPVPDDAKALNLESGGAARVNPLARSKPKSASGTLPEARSDGPDQWERLVTEGGSERSWVATAFDDLYVQSLPHDLHRTTEKEVNFVEKSLHLQVGASILDAGCGFGRHAIALAQRGFQVTGIDMSKGLLERAQHDAATRGAAATFLLGDIRQLDLVETFDGFIMLGTTFGYFDDRVNLEVLKRLKASLRPGGRALVEFMNRDRLVNELPRVTWWRQDNRLYLDESEFDFERSRLCTKRTVIFDDGSPFREQYCDLRLYSLHEVHALLSLAGFKVAQISGSHLYPELFFPMNSRQLYVLLEKE